MTWLLNKLQKVFGLLIGRRSNTHISESTDLGDEIASRLQSSNVNNTDPVALRVKGDALPSATHTQSTAPLRQKNASVAKDLSSVATEPDTHQRLDAAPASLPGGTLAAPNFPADVSELISAQSSRPPVLKANRLDELHVPDVPPTPKGEQLPEIHDLLPAVEPIQPDSPLAVEALPSLDAEVAPAEHVVSSELSETTVVESAQRVSPSDQATLFSFDIVETGESSKAESVSDADLSKNVGTGQSSEVDAALELSDQVIADQLAEIEVPIVESLIPDTLLDDLPTQISDRGTGDKNTEEQSAEEQSPEELNVKEGLDLEERSTEDRLTEGQKTKEATDAATVAEVDSTAAAVQNPWLTASPVRQKEKKRVVENSSETLTKNGTVKLLFKLKEGNFHGYITPEDGTKDILFHQKYINADIFDRIDRGTPVVVSAKYIEGKAYATRVELLQK